MKYILIKSLTLNSISAFEVLFNVEYKVDMCPVYTKVEKKVDMNPVCTSQKGKHVSDLHLYEKGRRGSGLH